MNTDDEKLPMDDMEAPAPVSNEPEPLAEQQEPAQARERDESGRFKAAGEPNGDAAARRERQERDQYKREAEEAKAAHAALQKRLDDMASMAKGEEPEAKPQDPLSEVVQKIDGLNQRFEQQDQERQQQEAHRQVLAYADEDQARFVQEKPDFEAAAQHYINSRLQEMKALGVDQQQAEQLLADEANRLLYQSAQTGRSAAASLYAMAQARGYQPGGAPAYAAPQQQNFGGRSLGNGGQPGPSATTAAQIAAMSEEDYMAFRSTPEGRRAIQRAMGG